MSWTSSPRSRACARRARPPGWRRPRPRAPRRRRARATRAARCRAPRDGGELPPVRRRVEVGRVRRLVGAATSRGRPWLAATRRGRGRAGRGTRPGRRRRGPSGGSSRRSRRRGSRPAPRPRTRSPRRTRRPAGRGVNKPPGCAPSGASQTASTRCAGIRTRCDQGRRSSTTRSTVTIAPRRAASAPHTPSRSGGWRATFPAGRRRARAAARRPGAAARAARPCRRATSTRARRRRSPPSTSRRSSG